MDSSSPTNHKEYEKLATMFSDVVRDQRACASDLDWVCEVCAKALKECFPGANREFRRLETAFHSAAAKILEEALLVESFQRLVEKSDNDAPKKGPCVGSANRSDDPMDAIIQSLDKPLDCRQLEGLKRQAVAFREAIDSTRLDFALTIRGAPGIMWARIRDALPDGERKEFWGRLEAIVMEKIDPKAQAGTRIGESRAI